MEKITISAKPKPRTRSYEKNGEKKFITVFFAERNGDEIMCETWDDRVALLTENLGKEVEVESIVSKDFKGETTFMCTGGFFGRGAGGAGGKFGNRPFVPAGYKGKPIPFEKWIEHSAGLDARFLAVYWSSVALNVTFMPGFEPAAASEKPADAAVASKDIGAGSSSTITEALSKSLSVCEHLTQLEGIKPMIASSGLSDEQKQELYGQYFLRKKSLTTE